MTKPCHELQRLLRFAKGWKETRENRRVGDAIRARLSTPCFANPCQVPVLLLFLKKQEVRPLVCSDNQQCSGRLFDASTTTLLCRLTPHPKNKSTRLLQTLTNDERRTLTSVWIPQHVDVVIVSVMRQQPEVACADLRPQQRQTRPPTVETF